MFNYYFIVVGISSFKEVCACRGSLLKEKVKIMSGSPGNVYLGSQNVRNGGSCQVLVACCLKNTSSASSEECTMQEIIVGVRTFREKHSCAIALEIKSDALFACVHQTDGVFDVVILRNMWFLW